MARILIVDDDEDFIESITAVLEGEGYKVSAAHNGSDGFDKAKKEKPDLMILDVMMTNDSEGFEVARKLHEDAETKNLPVVMITGIRKAKGLPFAFEPDEDWLPVNAVLEKPVKPEILLKKVKEALGK
jgi:two-component system, OmpR family, alkaline phosphatase synthesis response regulator PhoP